MSATKWIPVTWGCLAILPLFLPAAAYCDTVTTTDNLSVYGTIKEVTATTITLEGTFKLGTKSYAVPRAKVTRIDLNSTVFNPGAPPKTLGLGPGDDKKGPPLQPSQQASQEDTVVLRGNTAKPCKLMAIDASTVHCEGSDYPRSRALYILVGRGQ
jgi:hypothetical protein